VIYSKSGLWTDAAALSSPRLELCRAILRRLVIVGTVLIGVSALTFFVLGILPGNAAQTLFGQDATPEQLARIEAELNLDRPILERYNLWAVEALHGNLGHSLASHQSATKLLADRLPVTIELVVLALLLSLILAVPAALVASRWPARFIDRSVAAINITTLSIPSYVFALILVLMFSVHLRLLPAIGFVPLRESVVRNLESMTLPALAIALPLFGLYTRFLRGDLLEQLLHHDYIVAAKAKGIGSLRILVRHALPNSISGLLTVIGVNFGALIGGTVIIEQIFALPGIGKLLLESVHARDVPIVQAIVVTLAAISTGVNLAIDALYGTIDPRTRNASF